MENTILNEQRQNNGFIKLYRSELIFDLIGSHPMAAILLTVIALRARRKNSLYLKAGQAFIGDYEKYGMTRMQYRVALKHLKNNHLITTRTTNRGTIATLIDSAIYDISIEAGQPAAQPSKQGNSAKTQPSDNYQTATNNNERMKEEEYKKTYIQKNFKSKNKPLRTRSFNYDPKQYAGCIEL